MCSDCIIVIIFYCLLQVWFQNRRAKWRRQEKMESTSIKVNENFPMATLQQTATFKQQASLPIDPWFALPNPNATGLHALPGLFTHAHAQGMSATYQSYFTPGPNTIPITISPSLATLGSLAPGQGSPPNGHISVTNVSPKSEDGSGSDVRSSSIVSLRMKAKEHMEHLGRTLTGPC